MKLLSVNVSPPKAVEFRGKIIRTGIFKEPVAGRVPVRTLNIDGDGQADLIAHGGEQRAVLVYSHENYDFWAQELKRTDFSFGQFGENFTVEGMLDGHIHVGDRFRIGTALFEVSQPRVTCYKLAMKMKVDGFYNRMLETGRPGFYLRVLQDGEVGAGDEIELVSTHPAGISVQEMSNLLYFGKDNLEAAEKALTIDALSPGWKKSFADRIAKAKLASRSKEAYRTFIVTKKVEESDVISSFYLTPGDDQPCEAFLPGQFLPLKLDIPAQYIPVYRTYSLSDSPSRDHYRLTIKRELAPPNRPDLYPGVSSNYFHDEVDVGTRLSAKSPRGKFVLDPSSDRPVVLVSAGVGFTPLISMLNAIADAGAPAETWFIHGTRSSGEHAMGAHVRQLTQTHGNIHAHIRYSRPRPGDREGIDYDDRGRIDVDLIERLVRDTDRDFYVCGPAPFMRAIFDGLLAWGVSETQIHYEFFGPASALGPRKEIATPKRLAEASACCNELTVTFASSGITANWNPSLDSILDLAEANGLSPDYSCRSGICHTCLTELEEGEVDYVLEPLDTPAEGSVLICCSRPKTNITVNI